MKHCIAAEANQRPISTLHFWRCEWTDDQLCLIKNKQTKKSRGLAIQSWTVDIYVESSMQMVMGHDDILPKACDNLYLRPGFDYQAN